MNGHPIVVTLRKKIEALSKEAKASSTYVRTGDIRRVVRSINRDLITLSVEERLDLAEHLYTNSAWKCSMCATHILSISVPEIEKHHLPHICKFSIHFDDWGKVDDFGTTVLNQLIEKFPDEILQMIHEWNHSENMWERRLSMVAFTRKIGKSGKYTDECLELAENLIDDPEDLVQKAVGWALKDTMRGDKDRVLAYVKNLRIRGKSAVITLYAIRDLKGKEREEVLALKSKKKKRKKP